MLFFFQVSNSRNFTTVDAKVTSSFITIKHPAMKSLLIASATALVALSSCSVYRDGQTPDDVYYSPGRSKESAAYVQGQNDRDDGRRMQDSRSYYGYDDYASPQDRWLMMRVRNRYRWSYFDNYGFYDPYNPFGYGGGFGGFGYSPGFSLGLGYGGFGGYSGFGGFGGYGFYDPLWGPYYWNSYYNPYYPGVVVVNPKYNPGGTGAMRNFNLNSYSRGNYNNNRPAAGRYNRPTQGYNNSNNNRTLGNSFRRVFSNSNNATVPRNNETYRPTQTRPAREYNPSSNRTYDSPRPSSGSSNSGSSSGSSGGGSGSRPSRR
jgi:hypothetical protein